MVDIQKENADPGQEVATTRAPDTQVSWEAYLGERNGPLEPGTYRVLDCGTDQGWYFELELDGSTILLTEDPNDKTSAYAVHRDRKLADELARRAIAAAHGEDAAQKALFKVVWGGTV